jgi:hypothetical protein
VDPCDAGRRDGRPDRYSSSVSSSATSPGSTHLFLYTDRAVRRTVPALGLGKTIFASDDVTPEDVAAYDEVVRLPPVGEMEATLRILDGIRADHVFFQTEFGLLPGSLLAKRRGLSGPTPDVAHVCVNKLRSRLALRDAGVRIPAFGLCETAADVRRLGLGYPIVLKPVASTLGRGVSKVESDGDLGVAVDRLRAFLPRAPDVARLVAFGRLAGVDLGCDPTRQFLAEAFADGPPREADGLVVGDRIDLFGITEQVVRDGAGFYIEAYLLPADEPGACASHALAAVRAHGLADTGFSIEFRGDTVIEVNGRLGEDDGFPDLFRAAIGYLPMDLWFRAARNKAFQRPVEARPTHALAYVNRYAGGVVRRVGVLPDGVVVPFSVGQRLAPLGDPAFRPHVAYTIASHPTSSRSALAIARERLAGIDLAIEDLPTQSPSASARGPS